MNKNIKKDINKKFFYWFNILLNYIYTSIKLIIYTIIILGSTSAFLLYLKQYPGDGLRLYGSFSQIFKILFKILQTFVGITIGLLIGWLSFNILEPVFSKSKIRREEKREEFLNDLSVKLKKKLKTNG